MGRPIGYNQKIEIPIEELKELYLEKNLSTRQIAEIYNTSKTVIARRLNENKIQFKNKGCYKKEKVLMHEYYYVMVKDHPGGDKDGYVLEHRYVMEQKIGRYLTNNEIVHHINLNKLDNRIENLQVMTIAEHDKLHHTKQIDVDELIKLREQGMYVKDICSKFKISINTYYRKLKKIEECV